MCVLMFFALSSCSDDEPQYWDYNIYDEDGYQFYDEYVSADEHIINLTIESSQNWAIDQTHGLTITPMSGQRGTTHLTLHIGENTSRKSVEKYFTIRNTEYIGSEYSRSSRINITQKGVLHLLVNPSQFKLNKENGTVTATVTTNLEEYQFNVEAPSWVRTEWIGFDSDDNGDIRTSTLQIKYDYNPYELRTGNINITSNTSDLSTSIYLIQNGAQGTPY